MFVFTFCINNMYITIFVYLIFLEILSKNLLGTSRPHLTNFNIFFFKMFVFNFSTNIIYMFHDILSKKPLGTQIWHLFGHSSGPTWPIWPIFALSTTISTTFHFIEIGYNLVQLWLKVPKWPFWQYLGHPSFDLAHFRT